VLVGSPDANRVLEVIERSPGPGDLGCKRPGRVLVVEEIGDVVDIPSGTAVGPRRTFVNASTSNQMTPPTQGTPLLRAWPCRTMVGSPPSVLDVRRGDLCPGPESGGWLTTAET